MSTRPPAPPPPPPNPSLGTPAAALAMVGWAASGVISKGLAEIGPLAVTFWRMWLYTAVVLVFLWLNGAPLRLASVKVSAAGGVSLAFDIMLFFTSVRLTTIANATVMTSLQPVLIMLIAPRLFGEHPTRRHWALNGVAVVGVAVVVFGSSGLPEWSPVGDALSLLTLFAWTGYFLFSKLSTRRIDSSQYTAGSALVCSLVVTPFALASGQVFDAPSAGAWLWLGVLAVGPGFASHMLMNWSLARIPAWFGSTLTLAIPVSSTLLAWAFLDERVALLQFVGMGVVMLALSAVVADQSRSTRNRRRADGLDSPDGPDGPARR
ncbi:MAG TPA: hypothetical protein DEP66_05680 [Acidimicrobiaceae bacterium]|nr:hypothetical protein [Acidimicrobiaceae bacterium]HCB37684.1 hypothetical protein [Acidimicrobiaceae bacterium]